MPRRKPVPEPDPDPSTDEDSEADVPEPDVLPPERSGRTPRGVPPAGPQGGRATTDDGKVALSSLRKSLKDREAELATAKEAQLRMEQRLRALERATSAPPAPVPAPPMYSAGPPNVPAGRMEEQEYSTAPPHAGGTPSFSLRRKGPKRLSNGATVEVDVLMPQRYTFTQWPTRWDPMFQEAVTEGGQGIYQIVDSRDAGKVLGRITIDGAQVPGQGPMGSPAYPGYGPNYPAGAPPAGQGGMLPPALLLEGLRDKTPLEAAYANYQEAVKSGDQRLIQVAGGAYVELAKAAAHGQSRGGGGGSGGDNLEWLKGQVALFTALQGVAKGIGGSGEDHDVAMRRLDIEERRATMDGLTSLTDKAFDRLHDIVADVKPKTRDMGDIRKEAERARAKAGQGGPGGAVKYMSPPNVGSPPPAQSPPPPRPQAPPSPPPPGRPPQGAQPAPPIRPSGGKPALGGSASGVTPHEGTPQAAQGANDPSRFAPYPTAGLRVECRWCTAEFESMTFWEAHMPCPSLPPELKPVWGNTPMPHGPVARPAPAPAAPPPEPQPAPHVAAEAPPPPPPPPPVATAPGAPYAGLPDNVKEFMKQFRTITDCIVGYGRCAKLIREGGQSNRCDGDMTFSGGMWTCPSCGNRVSDYETTGSPERTAKTVLDWAKPDQREAIATTGSRGFDALMQEFRPYIEGVYRFPDLDKNQVLALVDVLDAAGICPEGGMRTVFPVGGDPEQMKRDMGLFVNEFRQYLDIQLGPDGERWYKRFLNAFCSGMGIPPPHQDMGTEL